jgi:hypothetical protein
MNARVFRFLGIFLFAFTVVGQCQAASEKATSRIIGLIEWIEGDQDDIRIIRAGEAVPAVILKPVLMGDEIKVGTLYGSVTVMLANGERLIVPPATSLVLTTKHARSPMGPIGGLLDAAADALFPWWQKTRGSGERKLFGRGKDEDKEPLAIGLLSHSGNKVVAGDRSCFLVL